MTEKLNDFDFLAVAGKLNNGKNITDQEALQLVQMGYIHPGELSGKSVGRCLKQVLESESLEGGNAAARVVEIMRRKAGIFVIDEKWAEKVFAQLPKDCCKSAIPILEDQLEEEGKIESIAVIEGCDFGSESGNIKALLTAARTAVVSLVS